MKFTLFASLLATAAAFSINKADIQKVSIESCFEIFQRFNFQIRNTSNQVYSDLPVLTLPFFLLFIRPPPSVPSLSDLPSNPLSPPMLETENKCSTPTALHATPEDKTLSCPRRPLKRKPLSNTFPEEETRRLSSPKSPTERTPCLLSEDVLMTMPLLMLPPMSLPLPMPDGSKLLVLQPCYQLAEYSLVWFELLNLFHSISHSNTVALLFDLC